MDTAARSAFGSKEALAELCVPGKTYPFIRGKAQLAGDPLQEVVLLRFALEAVL